ncbi:MAG: TaqI-like C-terminal specificity domain-containing protein, partial [Rikenellaceae bacterium]
SLFMLASLRLLSSGGYMGFLVQGALFNIASYEAIRKHLLNHNITNLLDFDRPFKSLMTKAQAVILKNEPTLNNQVLCESSSRSYYRDARSFQDNPCCILNMWSTPQSSDVIERLLKQPHTTLQKHVRWGLGIVTGNNRRFISSTPNSGYINIFRGEDITEVGFKESPLYIPDDMSLYQQVAPVELWRAECKIVYKFISSKLTFMCDREQRFVLNSANFFILDREFPLSAEQLVQLLNSNFMNWYFHELYNTHKILRRDLEALPIFCDYFTAGKIFNEDEYLNHIGVERVEHTEYRVKIEVGTNI